MLHGLQIGILGVLDIPDPDDGVPTRRVQPLEEGIELEGVDPGAVTPLALVTDNK